MSSRTVSRVVNDEPGFSEDTRRRVQAAIAELGYRPNFLARGLVTNRTGMISLIITDLTNPFFSGLAAGVQHEAHNAGLTLTLSSSSDDAERQQGLVDSLVSHGTDGVIAFPVRDTADQLAEALPGIPLVVIDHPVSDDRVGQVQIGLRKGAAEVVDYLVGRGHTHIGMVASANSSVHQRWREKGFRDGARSHGLTLGRGAIERGQPTESGGRESALRLLQRRPELTAIFAYNDACAIGVIQACAELGRRVPDGVAVVGCDDVSFARVVSPALTTLRIDTASLGREAVTMLRRIIDDRGDVPPLVELTTTLIERESA